MDASLLVHAPPIRRRQALHCLDQRRQRGFAIGRDREIDFLQAPEVLIVCANLFVHVGTIEAQQPPRGPIKFDEFSDLSTDDAMAHLDLFEAKLQHEQDLIGVIVGYRSEAWPTGTYLRGLYGYGHYLVNSRGVQPDRLKTVYAGVKDRSRTELWLLEPGMAAPVTSVALTGEMKLLELFDSLSKGPGCESEFSIALEEASDSVRFFVDALQRDPNVNGYVVVQPSRHEASRNGLKLLETLRKLLDGYNLPPERVSVGLGSTRFCKYIEFWLLPASAISSAAVFSEGQLRTMLFGYAEQHQFTVRRVEFIGNTYTRDRTLRIQIFAHSVPAHFRTEPFSVRCVRRGASSRRLFRNCWHQRSFSRG